MDERVHKGVGNTLYKLLIRVYFSPFPHTWALKSHGNTFGELGSETRLKS